jgi:hypothetical protein
VHAAEGVLRVAQAVGQVAHALQLVGARGEHGPGPLQVREGLDPGEKLLQAVSLHGDQASRRVTASAWAAKPS